MTHPRAIAFGEDRGWKIRPKDRFGWRALAGVRESFDGRIDLPPGCDHTWLYMVKRSPIAIVTFPYPGDIERNLEAMVDLTLEQNLRFEIMSYKLNWYGYGTIMVLWTRKDHDVYFMRVKMGAT